jgi:hypothetical protein
LAFISNHVNHAMAIVQNHNFSVAFSRADSMRSLGFWGVPIGCRLHLHLNCWMSLPSDVFRPKSHFKRTPFDQHVLDSGRYFMLYLRDGDRVCFARKHGHYQEINTYWYLIWRRVNRWLTQGIHETFLCETILLYSLYFIDQRCPLKNTDFYLIFGYGEVESPLMDQFYRSPIRRPPPKLVLVRQTMGGWNVAADSLEHIDLLDKSNQTQKLNQRIAPRNWRNRTRHSWTGRSESNTEELNDRMAARERPRT